MRLLFVNHLHPNTGLVGALRMQRFAEELATRGHQVLLLCACHEGIPDTPESFQARISNHDWTHPLLLAVRDDSFTKLQHMPTGRWRPIPRARTAAKLIFGGGPFWRWQRAARAFQTPIHEHFVPDLAYATFGNLDALAIARDYAHAGRIPWVMDIKDPASAFIPKPLAWWLMPRFRDAAAVTLNSEFQRSHNRGWADDASTVIYSGVEAPPTTGGAYDAASVALVGSIYTDEAAVTLLRGFVEWRTQHVSTATLHYFGVDGARVAAIAKAAQIDVGLIIEGQVARRDLLARCTRMAALLYAAHPQHTFHHKLLELAALGRPLVTRPAGGSEADALCARFHINHVTATTATAVCNALAAASATATANMAELISEMSWASAAARLEAVFVRALQAHTTKGARQ